MTNFKTFYLTPKLYLHMIKLNNHFGLITIWGFHDQQLARTGKKILLSHADPHFSCSFKFHEQEKLHVCRHHH